MSLDSPCAAPPVDATALPVRPGPHRPVVRWSATLAVLSLAQFLIALDYSIVYVALPSIERDLRLEPALAQWVVSAYAVLFAGFLVVGGRLSDRVGPKRLLMAGVAGFGVASAVGGAAQGGAVLLAARAGQGLAAAVLQPAVLALIGTTFPAGPLRSRALAVWGSVGASGLAVGAIAGGLLTTASWRLTFAVNVPLTLLCAVGAVTWVGSDRRPPRSKPVPVVASLLGTGSVLAVVLGLTASADLGWRAPLTRLWLGLALVLFAAFIGNERRSANPLVEPLLRRTRSLRTGATATALYMASVGSEFYLLTLLLQSGRGYSPLEAGLAFLPLAAMVTVGSAAVGHATRRLPAKTVLAAGFALAAVGLSWLALALGGDSYAVDLLPGLLLSGLGHGVVYTSMFVIGTHDVPGPHQGTAGALLTTSQYLSGALTVAVLTLVLGPSPDDGQFRTAVLVTGAAAAAGFVLAATRRPRLPATVGV